MRNEFLNLLLLLLRQLFLPNFVAAKHFHKACHVFNENVVAGDHDLLVTVASA